MGPPSQPAVILPGTSEFSFSKRGCEFLDASLYSSKDLSTTMWLVGTCGISVGYRCFAPVLCFEKEPEDGLLGSAALEHPLLQSLFFFFLPPWVSFPITLYILSFLLSGGPCKL